MTQTILDRNRTSNMDKITEYSQTSGESDPPTIDDYINLGINTVTEDNISTINTALAEQNNIETITELQTVIDQVLTQQTAVASFELGAQLYADNCSLCHMPLASTDKPNRSVLSLTSAITVIPQMQFLQLNDVELESLEIALSGNTEVVSCEVETIAPRLSRLTPSQYDNTVQTFIPDVVTNPSDDFVSSLSSGRFSTDNSVLSMSTPHVSQLIDVSDTLAELLVAKPETLAACTNSDGDFGDVIISGNGSSASTTIDFDSISAQYIRIEQVGSASNGWGIGDLNIFNNGIAIDRSDWELEASDNIAITDLAIDNTDTTRWVTSVSQAGGEWVTIDLGSEQTFDQIILNQRPKNASAYPRAYEIRIASDAIETGISESECEDLFFNELLTRAFRRPIESEELAIYRGFYEYYYHQIFSSVQSWEKKMVY